MRDTTRKVLAMLTSALLAFGLVPSQGLAQIVEVGVGDGDAATVLGDESDGMLLGTQANDYNLDVSGTYDEEYQEIAWDISFKVPAEGLHAAVVTGIYPSATIGGETHREKIGDGYDIMVSASSLVTMLQEHDDKFVLTFYKDDGYGRQGIPATGTSHEVTVKVYVPLDQDWYDASVDDVQLADHVFDVTLEANDSAYTVNGKVTLQKPQCEHYDARVYTQVDCDRHHWVCTECGQSSDEQHSYEDDGGVSVCTACGQRAARVSFFAGEGATGFMPAVYREVGSSYTLPLYKYSAPDGLWFNAWEVRVGDSEPMVLPVGESVPLSANTTVTALWNTSVPFVGEGGGIRYRSEYSMLGDTDTLLQSAADKDAWYVVTGAVDTARMPITVVGDVSIILCDGARLVCDGIEVQEGSALHIYGQQEGSGTIAGTSAAAISNKGTLVVCGGRIGDSSTGILSDGELVLHGGVVSGNVCGVNVTGGSITVGYSPRVENNGIDNQASNVLLSAGNLINVDKPLSDGARIGFMLAGVGTTVFTSEYGRYNPEDDPKAYFFSDDPSALVQSELVDSEATFSKNVTYVNESGAVVYLESEWEALEGDSSKEIELGDGWYVLTQDSTFSKRMRVKGDAKLLLCDGCTLTCSAGINVSYESTFSVYCQEGRTGAIVAKASSENYAGIGGHNGNTNGTINIYGGNISATGAKYSPGIGGGGEGGSGGTINIYDGTVTAKGGSEGAGIGGGDEGGSGGTINIHGGTVTATATGSYGAGIGGGDEGKTGRVTITGGTVVATGAKFAAGIGSGDEAESTKDCSIVISGGVVEAYGGDEAAGIGGGNQTGGGTIAISGRHTRVLAKGGCNGSHEYGAGIGGGDEAWGCDIVIEGGAYVEAFAATNSGGQAIGHGDGSSNSGELTFDMYAAVRSDSGIATADKRVSMCRNSKHVIVYKCDHADGTVTPTADGLCHSASCTHCENTGARLSHDYDDDGQCLCGLRRFAVTFAPGTGTGDPKTEYVYELALQSGAACALYDAEQGGFVPPVEGASLLGWQLDDVLYAPGDLAHIDGHCTFTALWDTPWERLQKQVFDAQNGSTVVVDQNVTALEIEQPITIPQGKTITIDLGGHVLDRDLEVRFARPDGNVVVNKGALTIKNGTVTGGKATGNGAGIRSLGPLWLDGVTVSYNSSNADGGGISLEGAGASTSSFVRCEIAHNFAENGGGLNCETSKLEIQQTNFTHNEALSLGGALTTGNWPRDRELTVSIEGGTFEHNEAYFGGVGYVSDWSSTIFVSDAVVAHNKATGGRFAKGGAFFNNGTLELEGTTLDSNESTGVGGAVYAASEGTERFHDTTVTNNKAAEEGGGIYKNTGDEDMWVSGRTVIWSNTANGKANNVFLDSRYVPVRFDGLLDPEASIGVTSGFKPTASSVFVFTEGLRACGGSFTNFVSDDAAYAVGYNADGEAILGLAATVSFEPGGAAGQMEPVVAAVGSKYEVPAHGFEQPAGITFRGWAMGNEGRVVNAGTVIDISGDTTFTAQWNTLWVSLQERIDAAQNGATVALVADTVAQPDDAPITIAANKTVTLDLAGFALDRGLADGDARENGNVIVNDGMLAIAGGGTITGGNVTGDGGGVYNAGTLALADCSITGNRAGGQGGGVLQDGEMSVSGSCVVANNAAATGQNVYLRTGKLIDVGGTLDDSARIGVDVETVPTGALPTVITSGLEGNGSLAAFASDRSPYIVGFDEGGEAILGVPVTVRFDAGGGKGAMENAVAPQSGWWELPACGFAPASGMKFAGWRVNGEGDVLKSGQRIPVLGDVVLRASWDSVDPFWFPSFKTVSLVLSGQIGVNFFVDLSGFDEYDREACRMTFEVNGKTQEDTYDATFTDSITGKYYGFTCFVNSVQMADTIQATLCFGDRIVSQTYSVDAYVKEFQRYRDYYDDATSVLIESLADYGHYAQPFLSTQNNWTIGKEHAEMATRYTDSYNYDEVTASLAEHTVTYDCGTSNVDSLSYRLVLDSGTMLDLFMDAGGANIVATGTFNGKTYEAERQKDGRYRIRVPNISAHLLGETLHVEGDSGGEFSVDVSALSFAHTVLSHNLYGNEGNDAMCAFAAYYEAVKAYR